MNFAKKFPPSIVNIRKKTERENGEKFEAFTVWNSISKKPVSRSAIVPLKKNKKEKATNHKDAWCNIFLFLYLEKCKKNC